MYVDATNGIVYDSLDSTDVIDLSGENGVARVLDSEGNVVSVGTISRGTVFALYKSLGGYVEAQISNAEVTGIYSGETEHYGVRYFIIGDEEYPVNDKFYDKIKSSLTVNQSITFKLDSFGEVVAVSASTVSADYYFGYYLSYSNLTDDNESDEPAMYIKLFSEEEGLKKYKMAEKVKIDGQNKKYVHLRMQEMPLQLSFLTLIQLLAVILRL